MSKKHNLNYYTVEDMQDILDKKEENYIVNSYYGAVQNALAEWDWWNLAWGTYFTNHGTSNIVIHGTTTLFKNFLFYLYTSYSNSIRTNVRVNVAIIKTSAIC